MGRSQASTVAIATKITLSVLLFGCYCPVGAAPEVCVLAPQLAPASPGSSAVPTALVPISQPTLFIREPLAELRIERGETLLWTRQSEVGSALEGPLAWPLSPLKPGETVTVRLRPINTALNNYASIQLVGAPAQRLKRGNDLLRALVGRPAGWLPTIETLLAKGDRSLATALLFAFEGPNDPDLNALRMLVTQESCP